MSQFNPSDLKYEFKDFIGIYENAFTKEECEDVIKLYERLDKIGYTYERKNDGLVKKDGSTFYFHELELGDNFIHSYHRRFYNLIYSLYNNKYSILQNLNRHRSKYMKIQKTLPTEGYHVWHCEYEGSTDNRNRVLSWILYLNDVEEGGETEFLYQSMRIKPKTGTFILFPAYFTHTHRGNPPLSGEKYIATGWIEFLNTSEVQGKSEPPNLTSTSNQNKMNYT